MTSIYKQVESLGEQVGVGIVKRFDKNSSTKIIWSMVGVGVFSGLRTIQRSIA